MVYFTKTCSNIEYNFLPKANKNLNNNNINNKYLKLLYNTVQIKDGGISKIEGLLKGFG